MCDALLAGIGCLAEAAGACMALGEEFDMDGIGRLFVLPH
jgi:hypothetical protein